MDRGSGTTDPGPRHLPPTTNALVLRTDFSDDGAWHEVCAAIERPVEGFQAYVDFVDDPQWDGISVDEIVASSAHDKTHRSFLFVVDATAIAGKEHAVLVVDLLGEPGRAFRAIPSEMWGVENNLSLANMDFTEFADAADEDGVFRGFPR
jgi:hypothetical protein